MSLSTSTFDPVDLPAPRVDEAWAEQVAAERWGLAVTARGLGSNQDANFLLSAGAEPVAVLKVSNPVFGLPEVEVQDRAADLIAEAYPELRICQVLRDDAGAPQRAVVNTPDGPAVARLIRFLGGGTLFDRGHVSPRVAARLGEVAAKIDVALARLDDGGATVDGVDRELQWDLRFAAQVLDALGGALPEHRRAEVLAAGAAAWRQVARVADDLPRQVVHLDVTDDNVVVDASSGLIELDGVIDFSDLTRTWTVSELAIAVSSILHHPGNDPVDVLPAVRAYHAVRPLSAAEADALWPLVVLRGAVLVASGCHQTALDGDNDYAETRLAHEWRICEQAMSVPLAVMTALVREAIGLPVDRPAPPLAATQLLDAAGAEVLDLSSTSPLVDDGAWREAELVERLVAAHLQRGHRVVAARFAEARLAGTTEPTQEPPATVATGVDLWTTDPADLRAPWGGDVRVRDGRVVLVGEGIELVLAGAEVAVADGAVAPGSLLGRTRPGARLRVTVGRNASSAPEAVPSAYAAGWLAQLLDPAPLMGLEPSGLAEDRTRERLLQRREKTLAEVQEHYYAAPPRIERGWRHHLVSDDGRPLVDMLNNVTVVGHAHPRVAEAAARQLRVLNTNSRFHYEAIVEFGARLAELAPEGLDTVFLVNSGSEATDLAIRLAMVSTGRTDMVAVTEAYHGWTYASDAVSTSIADNPAALETRPDWVHTVPSPNPYRGTRRGADAVAYGPEAAAIIDRLAAEGRPPAGFIGEAFYGNAGGIALPEGYLQAVYAAVRRHGGVAIADEVQVGYGRLGEWFWGFEQQGVVPDVIAVAKAVGNGSPVGAVITTRAIADAYRGAGYFFSSTGGSPVSSRIGLAVLDIIRDEGLQQNARDVGGHLIARLRELSQRHELLGAVHGSGLYIGAEFVRDRATLEPATAETHAICDRLLELGVVVQPTSDRLNVLKIKPPLCIDVAAVDFFVDALDRVLTEGW
ncbi:aminotransferase [Nocardioides sp.]|uniref:aminotransferase n=1 Tax=Nocardioides sp. TaxID=35761 RepID=UPI0035123AB2